jgi:hypothetical protein
MVSENQENQGAEYNECTNNSMKTVKCLRMLQTPSVSYRKIFFKYSTNTARTVSVRENWMKLPRQESV